MNAFLIFIAACAAIVAFGWIVSRITGAHAWFLESWKFEPGENVIWRDDTADVMVIPKWGGAVVMSPIRTRRWAVVVTNQRVIIANRTFTDKRMVRYVLYPRHAPDGQGGKLGGGLLTRGYQTVVIQPGAAVPHVGERFQHPYVALMPVAEAVSSFNMAEMRVYTDDVVGFRLPEAQNNNVGRE